MKLLGDGLSLEDRGPTDQSGLIALAVDAVAI